MKKYLIVYFLFVASLILPQGFADAQFVASQPATSFKITSHAVEAPRFFSSENWSGYIAAEGAYDAVGGTWIVPRSSGPVVSGEATWVGLGGYGRQDLIQIGTMGLIDHQGVVEYLAWYETLPDSPVEIPLQIRPGDSVSASIVPLSSGTNQWLLYMRNNTTGKNFQVSVVYNSSRTSAEWVVERPTFTGNSSYVPLTNFGNVQFTNAWVVKGGVVRTLVQANANKIFLLDHALNVAYAVPSDPGVAGAFSIFRTVAAFPTTNIASNSSGKWYRAGVSTSTLQAR